MYDVGDYGAMVADPVRTGAYARAIAHVVRPGDVVLDIGAGSGILSLLACRAGAARVYAIEPNEVVEVAREIAAANGYGERIRFHRAVSSELSLPEQADVLVSDLRGSLPVHGSHLAAIVDARMRLLSPGARVIPLSDTIRVVPVEDAAMRAEIAGRWTTQQGFNVAAGRRYVVNILHKARVPPERWLAPPESWAELDYRYVSEAAVARTMRFTCTRGGILDGFLAWFDALLAEGIGYSTAPDKPETVYGNQYFPLAESVELAARDEIELALDAHPVAGDYVWQWRTRLRSARGAFEPREFRQSTFHGRPISAQSLRMRRKA